MRVSALRWMLASVTLALSGCTAQPLGPAGKPPGGPAEREGSVAAGTDPAAVLAALEAAVRADAAGMWAVADPARVQVGSEAVTWSDGSLGCPRPGMMYTQALVPGWRLVASDGTREQPYHASRGGYWIRCPAGRAREPLPGAATR